MPIKKCVINESNTKRYIPGAAGGPGGPGGGGTTPPLVQAEWKWNEIE